MREEVLFKIQSGFRQSSAVSVARALVLDARLASSRFLRSCPVSVARAFARDFARSILPTFNRWACAIAHQLAGHDSCRLAAYAFVRRTSIQLGMLFFSILYSLYCPLVSQDMPKLMNETMVNFSLKYCI